MNYIWLWAVIISRIMEKQGEEGVIESEKWADVIYGWPYVNFGPK